MVVVAVGDVDERARWTADLEASTLSSQERRVRISGKNSVADATMSRICPNALDAADGSATMARLKGKIPWGDTASIAGSFVISNGFLVDGEYVVEEEASVTT